MGLVKSCKIKDGGGANLLYLFQRTHLRPHLLFKAWLFLPGYQLILHFKYPKSDHKVALRLVLSIFMITEDRSHNSIALQSLIDKFCNALIECIFTVLCQRIKHKTF